MAQGITNTADGDMMMNVLIPETCQNGMDTGIVRNANTCEMQILILLYIPQVSMLNPKMRVLVRLT